MNEEVKGWTSSPKEQEAPSEATNTKKSIRLEQMIIKVKRAALEWYAIVLHEQLNSLIYVNRSSRGYPNKDKLIH